MRILVLVTALVVLVMTGSTAWADRDPVRFGAATSAVAPAASSAAAPAVAISPEFEKSVYKLLEVSRAADMSKAGISRSIEQIKKAMPDVPEDFWTRLEAKLNLEINNLLAQLVPVYANHLSPEDVKSLIAFYESPLGQRFTAAQPKIASDATAVAHNWGRAISEKIMAEINAEQAKLAPKSAEAPASATPAVPAK
jgi:hypothetical protein